MLRAATGRNASRGETQSRQQKVKKDAEETKKGDASEGKGIRGGRKCAAYDAGGGGKGAGDKNGGIETVKASPARRKQT